MSEFNGKVAMVTGGATGIGAACVRQLAAEGAQVACCYNKSAAGAEALAEELTGKGQDVFAVRIDVTDSAQIKQGIAAIVAHFEQPIGILVNNVGDIIEAAPADEMDEELWKLVISINLTGVFLCAKYVIPGMKQLGEGRIINMGSISARTGGGAGASHYVASKGGVEALSRALANELAEYNITVNTVAPGVIYTPIHERHNTPESLEQLRQIIPLQRIGDPEEVAAAVTFLASDDAKYITGENIAVNGGKRFD